MVKFSSTFPVARASNLEAVAGNKCLYDVIVNSRMFIVGHPSDNKLFHPEWIDHSTVCNSGSQKILKLNIETII